MLTTSFSPERTSVQLPESIVRSEVTDQASIIAIKEDGTIMFTSGEEQAYEMTGPNELGQVAEEIIGLVKNKEFVIKADRNVPYQMVDSVLDALRSNGVTNIGLLTRPEPKSCDGQSSKSIDMKIRRLQRNKRNTDIIHVGYRLSSDCLLYADSGLHLYPGIKIQVSGR